MSSMTLAPESKTYLGFWLYLMTDCVLFATLFATYAVLQNSTAGGPGGHELFDSQFVLIETIILLTSSFTCGMAMVATRNANKSQALNWIAFTIALGLTFLAMEASEFWHLTAEGNGWQRSGFLSAFFTLVGTHGLHIFVGLLWLFIMMVQIISRGFTEGVVRRLTLASMFWHFLDIIWIFIFTIVYLMGVV